MDARTAAIVADDARAHARNALKMRVVRFK
jgi:hypothetical protein